MLGNLGNNVITGGTTRQADASNSQVIAFRATTRKNHFTRSAAWQLRYLLAREIQRLVGLLPIAMRTRWVAKMGGEIGQHRLNNSGINRRCRVVIKIDRTIL